MHTWPSHLTVSLPLQDTGQLCGTGEGTQTTRLGRHYLEDCHTGEFFQLAQQPTGGLWAWLRCGCVSDRCRGSICQAVCAEQSSCSCSSVAWPATVTDVRRCCTQAHCWALRSSDEHHCGRKFRIRSLQLPGYLAAAAHWRLESEINQHVRSSTSSALHALAPCRRGRRLGADGWFRGVGVQGDLQQQHEPGFLHSLSDFLDTMASGMAALGLFAQVCWQARQLIFASGKHIPGICESQTAQHSSW